MADREQAQTSKRGTDEKLQHHIAGKGHPTSGSKGEERQHGVRNIGSVGATRRTKVRRETRKPRSRPDTKALASTAATSASLHRSEPR
jgi:hypothetical protein